jgi:hypothetical protein
VHLAQHRPAVFEIAITDFFENSSRNNPFGAILDGHASE